MEQKRVLEAALFMAPRPLQLTELARISGLGSAGKLKGLLEELEKEYSERGIKIVSGPEGWEMQIDPGLLPSVAHLAPYTDLSEGCKRTLALIACREPMMQSELIKIQGNKAYNYIKRLARMGLVKPEKAGRTKLLHLTREFENYFGEEKAKIKQRLKEQYEKGEEGGEA
jgi:segregation and condensation protein B